MRLAAVDIGSNTVHALVADVVDEGRLEDVAHYVEMPSLGAAVSRTGEIGTKKRREAVTALKSVVRRAAEHGYSHLLAGATAAVREARDGPELLREASEAIGVSVRLISDALEAELSFKGVAMRHHSRGEWLMADVGGGSLELVPAAGQQMRAWASLPLGSGALADRYLSDPPREGERARLREAALPVLRGAPECDAEKLVATGGTASNLPLVLSRRNPPSVLDQEALLAAERRLDAYPAAEAAKRFGLLKARIKALRGGVELLLLLIDWYGLHHVHVSHEGLRHGMLLAYLEKTDGWADQP